jgi:predicted anti-sigma-YlaC factor YlaD
MRCRDFKKHIDYLLDTKQDLKISEKLAEHIAVCQECAQYFRSMATIDAALREKEEVTLPPGLESRLQMIPERSRHTEAFQPWSREIKRILCLLLPIVALSIGSSQLSPRFHIIVQIAIMTGALVTVGLTAMYRRLFPTSLEMSGHQN